MGFPIQIDASSMKLPIVYFKGSHENFKICIPEGFFIIAKRGDSDEMHHCDALHLGIYCVL